MKMINTFYKNKKLQEIIENNSLEYHLGKQEAVFSDFPPDLHPSIQKALSDSGIDLLFEHQRDAWELSRKGKDFVITTSTASGKTLCYQLPITQNLLEKTAPTALLIFPTKALAQDQSKQFSKFLSHIGKYEPQFKEINISVYDGDTPASRRKEIRQNSNILITNPDMLHLGILPHHTMWSEFLKNLEFIVIDEMHTYRGVLGSHFANIIRRLVRILQFYKSNPQFILSSATIANPEEFCEKLLGKRIELINTDSSSKPERNYYFVNPPIIDESLGIRRGMVDQTLEIAEYLINDNIQALIFARSRKTVEIGLLGLKLRLGGDQNIEGYRSGYLSKERREIENKLRSGRSLAVISTNALELGIDMGKVDAVLMMGYPGTKSSFFQQSGRSGRRENASIVFMVASQLPIDQYIIKQPEYIFSGKTEYALIDPDNPLILLNHFKCSLFELPFLPPFSYGSIEKTEIEKYLEVLVSLKCARKTGSGYYWISNSYPSKDISIRNISNNPISLFARTEEGINRIGEVDYQSSFKTVYPGAVYIHNSKLYKTEEFDFEGGKASLVPHDSPYITEPSVEVSIEVKTNYFVKQRNGYSYHFDELEVIEKVKGYKKIDLESLEILGIFDLDLPEINLVTKGLVINLNENFVDELNNENLWSNNANNYGKSWPSIRQRILLRDESICKICGLKFSESDLHVHHIIPFRQFSTLLEANRDSNLISLCSRCHKNAEKNLRMRSGLSGFTYLFANMAPIHLMCDRADIGSFYQSRTISNNGNPAMFIFDQFPGGIGLSAKLFSITNSIILQCKEVIKDCECKNGCPACVGPAGENGEGAKRTTLAIVNRFLSG